MRIFTLKFVSQKMRQVVLRHTVHITIANGVKTKTGREVWNLQLGF